MKNNSLKVVWDDVNKKFVPRGTLDWSWTKKLDCTLNRLMEVK